jgi:Nucleotidyl transferase of unknown function (DUF2204)
MTISEIPRVLDSLGISYALIGGHAVIMRGYVRMTVDFDFLTTASEVLKESTWTSLVGSHCDVRLGDDDDPFRGVVHIHLSDGIEADVLVGRWKWEQGVIDRAERMDVEGVSMPVPRVSDLILLKLAAGGHHDLRDASILLEISDRERVIEEVENHLEAIRPDVREIWKQLLISA